MPRVGESGRGVPSGLGGLEGGVESRVLRGEGIVGSGMIFGWGGFQGWEVCGVCLFYWDGLGVFEAFM